MNEEVKVPKEWIRGLILASEKVQDPDLFVSNNYLYGYIDSAKLFLEEESKSVCKCGGELIIGQSHHCNYLDGVTVRI